jgi:glycosyltransferase involved in cell wall biosynthesis
MSISVLILTLNEELNLLDCLESVSWSDDVVVFDSYSTDQTIALAKSAGVRVIQRRFDDYASQRNAALNDVDYKHQWVLMVDADERVTAELRDEMLLQLSRNSEGVTLYRVCRKDMLQGRWLRYSCGYPTWFGRLAKVGYVSVEREINEEYHTDGRIEYLKEHLIHFPFNKGIAHWFERHNRYSSMEAESLIREVDKKLELRHIFSPDPTQRRKHLKQLAFRLPCRSFWVFCYLYIVRMGFLDGVPGLMHCQLRAIYERMIDLKIKYIRGREERLSKGQKANMTPQHSSNQEHSR